MYRILLLAAAIISVCGVILVSTKGNHTSSLPKPPLNHEDKGMMAKILFE
jgi:drug/metabolite transporter (DMT)-like permease